MSAIKTKTSFFTLLLSMLIMLITASNFHWGKDNWKGILEADAKGYYAYLPAIFIYQDLNFGFLDSVETKYPAPHLYVDFRAHLDHGIAINKYYAGTALLQLPFFTIGHIVTSITGGETDGYSKWYLISVSWASLFYLFLGLFYLRKSLLHIGVKDYWVALLLTAFLFGSNLFAYSVVETGMSHVYSFSLISICLFYLLEFKASQKLSHLFIIAGLVGLIVFVRPVNMLVLAALPFIAGSWIDLKSYLNPLLNKPIRLLNAFLLFLAFPFLQLLIYKVSTGNWFVYSYSDEGFDFSNPHFFDILLSYKKGLFVYTPIYLFSFWGLIALWKINRFRFWAWLFFFGLLTYVFSSWWMWYYGGSFSSRVYVEYIPLFALLFGFGINAIRHKWQSIGISILIFMLVILCQFQTYQYRYYLIHYSEMTQEKYWDNFLKLP